MIIQCFKTSSIRKKEEWVSSDLTPTPSQEWEIKLNLNGLQPKQECLPFLVNNHIHSSITGPLHLEGFMKSLLFRRYESWTETGLHLRNSLIVSKVVLLNSLKFVVLGMGGILPDSINHCFVLFLKILFGIVRICWSSWAKLEVYVCNLVIMTGLYQDLMALSGMRIIA